MSLFYARPLKNNNDTRVDSASVFALMFKLKWDYFVFEPYYLYAYIGHKANSGLGFFEDLDESYINTTGFAGTWNITDRLQFRFDLLYGDENNVVVHYYESKGSLFAMILDYDTKTAFGVPGIIGWYNSGNGSKLQGHDDFGFLPVIATEDGFGPTILGFKVRDIVRRGILSETGVGTAGLGFQISDMQFINDLKHKFIAVYIVGTSRHQGSGAPISENVSSLILPEGE